MTSGPYNVHSPHFRPADYYCITTWAAAAVDAGTGAGVGFPSCMKQAYPMAVDPRNYSQHIWQRYDGTAAARVMAP